MIDYVYYDNTDCGGIVYHTNYIIFCERARSLIFFKRHMLPNVGNSTFVVKSIESNFIVPLKFGDKYEVRSLLLEIKHASMLIKQEIYKIGHVENKDITNELSFSMIVKIAFVNLDTKKSCKIPEILIQVLQDHILQQS